MALPVIKILALFAFIVKACILLFSLLNDNSDLPS
jgi:hypothetical protein